MREHRLNEIIGGNRVTNIPRAQQVGRLALRPTQAPTIPGVGAAQAGIAIDLGELMNLMITMMIVVMMMKMMSGMMAGVGETTK